jgi:hypothetical protein
MFHPDDGIVPDDLNIPDSGNLSIEDGDINKPSGVPVIMYSVPKAIVTNENPSPRCNPTHARKPPNWFKDYSVLMST